MPLIYPERPTRNQWQDLGQALQQAAGPANLLADMVERRMERNRQLALQEQEERRRQEQADREVAAEKRKTDTQGKLSKALKEGVPMEAPESLATGRPDYLMAMRPNAQKATVNRPATDEDILGIAAEGMDPYQTAVLAQRPAAAAASHGYKMDEIGARGENSRKVAEIRSRASERAAQIRARYGRGGSGGAPKDWKASAQDAQARLAEIEQDMAELEAEKPKHSWDLQPWNVEMNRLAGQQKFYLGLLYKASQAGEPADLQGAEDPGVGPAPAAPAPAPAKGRASRPLTDPNVARSYLQKAGGDKARARQLAAADGWSF